MTKPVTKKITILLTEDHLMMRSAWKFIFNADPRFDVVGECGSGEEAIELAKELSPDIIIMDINLPGITGIEATRIICKETPGSKVIGVSSHSQPEYARKMIEEGAMGYLTKTSAKEEIFRAVLDAHNGGNNIGVLKEGNMF